MAIVDSWVVRLLPLLLALHSCTAASATKVQWNVSGDFTNFPFGSPYPPYVIRSGDGTTPDRIVVVTGYDGSSSYTFSAFDATTGARRAANYTFTVAVPPGSNGELTTLTSAVPPAQQQNNSLSLLFLQIGTTVVAVDPASGQQLWTHPTYNQSTPKITGYSGDGDSTLYLTSSFPDTSRAVPTTANYIEALDPATGQVRWANATSLPPTSGVPTSDTAAAYGVTPLPGLAVYAKGNRLYGLSAANGSLLWNVAVSTGAGFGGAGANVSSVAYVEPPAGGPSPLLLLQSSTYDQTRFMGYVLNGSVDVPPVAAWQNSGNQDFEGSLNEGLARLGLAVPSVSQPDGVFVFWSNRTSYDLTNGGQPVYSTWLVGRSTATGGVVWAASANASGWSQLPVSPPTINVGVASVVTGGQVLVLQAGSGQSRFQYDAAPASPLSAGGTNSYVPITTFANDIGQLVVVRCLGSSQPGSLCAYNGYSSGTVPTGAAQRRRPLPAAGAAGLAVVAAACLLL